VLFPKLTGFARIGIRSSDNSQSIIGLYAVDDDETLTAYHEAGHAVIAYALGATVDSLQLWGEADQWLPERFGDCRINWGKVDPNSDWQRQREILTILAGPVAEMVYRGEPYHPAHYGPWQDDWQRAWTTCQALAPSPERRTMLLEGMMRQLNAHVRSDRCWAAIAALADELAAHEALEREQVAEILRFWIHSAHS